MEDCLFCKIGNGEIPSRKIHEDGFCYAVNDIHPQAKTHILVISNKHIASIAEMTDSNVAIIGNMVGAAKNIAQELGLPGYKLIFNVGKSGGQEIFHVHLHLMSDN